MKNRRKKKTKKSNTIPKNNPIPNQKYSKVHFLNPNPVITPPPAKKAKKKQKGQQLQHARV
jgi:hypothetical protein